MIDLFNNYIYYELFFEHQNYQMLCTYLDDFNNKMYYRYDGHVTALWYFKDFKHSISNNRIDVSRFLTHCPKTSAKRLPDKST